jgi:hypothetical protein
MVFNSVSPTGRADLALVRDPSAVALRGSQHLKQQNGRTALEDCRGQMLSVRYDNTAAEQSRRNTEVLSL